MFVGCYSGKSVRLNCDFIVVRLSINLKHKGSKMYPTTLTAQPSNLQVSFKQVSKYLVIVLIFVFILMTFGFTWLGYQFYLSRIRYDSYNQSLIDQKNIQSKSFNLSQIKLDIPSKDLILEYLISDNSTYVLLFDHTVMPHPSPVSWSEKGLGWYENKIISSWVDYHTMGSNPKISRDYISPIFLSADGRFLVFHTARDGISVYDYKQKKLVRSLNVELPEIKDADLESMTGDTIKLGLFEGMGGICDENAFEVNLLDYSVKKLQSDTTLKQC
jgi:hypothetical protein